MDMHEQYQHAATQHKSFLRRHWWLSLIALAIILYFLLTEHRQHVFSYLPFLLLLACPLMHFFMHGRHSGHQGTQEHHEDKNKDNR